ncbi:MAG TPA: ATP-binding cassette domain-containing protein [Acidimicrobiales bacterium]|nr:ATP-binding cassette domain-containing protein [Acidimicrobiales bacterium]
MSELASEPAALDRLRDRQEADLVRALWRADRRLAATWWAVLLGRGLLPAGLAVVTAWLIDAVQDGQPLGPPLAALGVTFVVMQVLVPLQTVVGYNLGDRTAAWLYDELTATCIEPPGMGHLEDPSLTGDLEVARGFDSGTMGPPLSVSMDFIADGLVVLLSGIASVSLLFGFEWWAPLVLGGAWGSTHWLLRESAVWKDRNTAEVQAASRDADYAYRMAVDPPAAKELRLFGLGGWTLDRFIARRRLLHELQYEATRLRERSVLRCAAVVVTGNALVFWALADAAVDGQLTLGRTVVFAQAAAGAAAIAFGGLNWALDGAAAPAAAVRRLRGKMAPAGALASGTRIAEPRAQELRFRDVSFAYPGTARNVLEGFDLTIPAGSSLAIVGQNGAGKTTLAKLLCRLYDPTSGSIEADGVDLRDLDVDGWRARITAVFQDFIRFELPLRDNVAPDGAPDAVVLAALEEAGAAGLAELDQPLSRAYDGGTDLSGGQWQRVALARALCAVRLGAGVVLLDEPTAQLDVRGEAEIFGRVLDATRRCTTILVSHRFSTVRRADRICVLEAGRVVELGTHAELMAARGRYRTMFDLQAQRFVAAPEDEGVELDAL